MREAQLDECVAELVVQLLETAGCSEGARSMQRTSIQLLTMLPKSANATVRSFRLSSSCRSRPLAHPILAFAHSHSSLSPMHPLPFPSSPHATLYSFLSHLPLSSQRLPHCNSQNTLRWLHAGLGF